MTSDESEKRNIEKMGEALGKQYSALCNEVSVLYFYWKEYIELFGTNVKRIERLNQAAPRFFLMLQDELFSTNMLHIARLTDPSETGGKANLTLRNLPGLVTDKDLKNKLTGLLAVVEQTTSFCRDWRNRRFAHYDLALAMEGNEATALEAANKSKVNTALKSLADVLNAVESHYFKGVTIFDAVGGLGGAGALLDVLGDGVARQEEREDLIRQGNPAGNDLPEQI